MENPNLKEKILEAILDRPGMARSELSCIFGLSDYRLKRVFRHIGRDLTGRKLVNSEKRGVWIVRIDPSGCLGVTWIGEANGGFVQCSAQPGFDDGCCFEHSQCENPSMVAFMRRLAFLAGPCAPSARVLSQSSITIVEDLEAELITIKPGTRKDELNKAELLEMLGAAKRFLYWKRRMHVREGPWIPEELLGRHRASSINPFEYSLKKHFVTLGVSPDATKEEVLNAWKRLARRYHPDLGKGDEERMKAINLAKERIFIIRRWDRRQS